MNKFERILSLVIFSLWSGAVLTLAIGKIVNEGLERYLYHFTNWGWTIIGLFFLADVLCRIEKSGLATFILVSTFLWLTNGVVYLISILVLIVVNDNPNLFDDMAAQSDGLYTKGFVLNMHILFHFFIDFMMILYMIFRREDIEKSIGFFMDSSMHMLYRFLYGFVILCSPILLAILYFVTIDYNQVYGINRPAWLMVLVGFLSLFVFNLLPFLVFWYRSTLKTRKYKRLLRESVFL
jgi:hypothetical protein